MADPVNQGGAVLTGEINSAARYDINSRIRFRISTTLIVIDSVKYLKRDSVSRNLYPFPLPVKRKFTKC
jgi:hypothetical protein